MPMKLRNRVVNAAHDGHQGLEKTKTLIRSKIWFPKIDDEVTAAVKNCRACQSAVNDTSREPLIMSELPEAPWESVVTDYYGPLTCGNYLITIIDEYSRFPVVKIVNSTSATAAIPKFDRRFIKFRFV